MSFRLFFVVICRAVVVVIVVVFTITEIAHNSYQYLTF
jgi:hypothetical protein